MNVPEDMAARHGRMLAEIAEIALAAARDLGQSLAEAATPQEKAVLMGALHRAGRSLRQSVALEARLVRDAGRALREARDEALAETRRKVDRRKAQVEAAVKRLIWTEREADEAERLESVLDELVGEDAVFDAFLSDPIELQIARLCEALGIQVSDVDHPREDEDPSGISSPETESGSSPAWVPAVAGSSDDLEFDAAPPPRGPP